MTARCWRSAKAAAAAAVTPVTSTCWRGTASTAGRTWSKLLVVHDDGANTCDNPCPVFDATAGVLWLLSTWSRGDDHERDIIVQQSKDPRRVFVSSSRDHGRTWSARREITAQAKRDEWTWYTTGPAAACNSNVVYIWAAYCLRTR